MNFLSTLRALDAAATPGPWMTQVGDNETRDDLPTRFWALGPIHRDDQWTLRMSDREGFKNAGADSALLTFLRNRAAAIAGVVEALQTISNGTTDDPRNLAHDALAALEDK